MAATLPAQTHQEPPRTALITGCGRKRVGHVIATHLANLGYNIAVHYHRSKDEAQQNADEYRDLGANAKLFQADVTDEAQVKQLVDDVNQAFTSIDVLVTTSSIWRSIPLEQLTSKQVLESFQVNTLGTFLCCQHVGLLMTRQTRGGNVITIGDSLIDHPYLDHAAYFTAKGAIETLTKSFAVELAHRNPKVRVNCIAPGPVMFPDDMDAKAQQRVIASTLTQVANDPNSVAKAVEFLLSASMITGTTISVDSGRNVGREQQARGNQL